ncbi:MAG: winged helix-turn-helix domain-containing protein [Euryarchaeota archaeon]|nr:winged helix-turn-helix domain-containing protein [Euryarchaeota archaeon]
MPTRKVMRANSQFLLDDLNLPGDLRKDLDAKKGLSGVLELIPERERLDLEAEQYNALSDPIRLQIMYSLKVLDMCPCVIKKITDLSDSKLSYHLSILEKAGMISSRQNRNWRIYSLTAVGRGFLMKRE